MSKRFLQTLNAEEFNTLLSTFIERVEPDTLSFEALDQAVERLAQETVAETIELTGVIQDDAIVFDIPETAPITVIRNEVFIGGLRLIVKLRNTEPATTVTTN